MLRYFDWSGSMEELNDYVKKVKAACDKTEGVDFKGLYGPGQVRWNWVTMIKTDSQDKLRETTRHIGVPKQMTHVIGQWLWPVGTFEREM